MLGKKKSFLKNIILYILILSFVLGGFNFKAIAYNDINKNNHSEATISDVKEKKLEHSEEEKVEPEKEATSEDSGKEKSNVDEKTIENKPLERKSTTNYEYKSTTGEATVDDEGYTVSKNLYGITGIKIAPFALYEKKNSIGHGINDNFVTMNYGQSLDVKWKLPSYAKAGEYFTLRWEDDIYVDYEPMYRDTEHIPYENLESQPSKYRDGRDNVFFTIYTAKSKEEPGGIPIIKVYLTRKNELTFVVQKFKNRVGELEGVAYIGRQIPNMIKKGDKWERHLVGMTDNTGRHIYSDDDTKSEVHENLKSHQFRDLWNLLWKTNEKGETVQNLVYFDGITPNRKKYNRQSGARQVGNDPYLWTRNVNFTNTYYGNSNIFSVPTQINFRTELFAKFDSPNNLEMGKEQIFPVYQDKDHIYFEYLYNNAGLYNKSGGSRYNLLAPLSPLKQNGFDNYDQKTVLIEEVKFYEGNAYMDGNGLHRNDPDYSSIPWIETDSTGHYDVIGHIRINSGNYIFNIQKLENQTYVSAKFEGGSASQFSSDPEKWAKYFNKILVDHSKKHGKDRHIVADVKARKMRTLDLNDGQKVYGIRMRVNHGNASKYMYALSGITEPVAAAKVNPKTLDFVKKPILMKKVDKNDNTIKSAMEEETNYLKTLKLKDNFGNFYTEDENKTGIYRDNHGNELSTKYKEQKPLYKDSLGNEYINTRDGATREYKRLKDNKMFYKKEHTNNTYVSDDGEIFYPSRPVIGINNIKVKATQENGKHVVYDSNNNKMDINYFGDKNKFQIFDRFGYAFYGEYANGNYVFKRWVDGEWENIDTESRDGWYTLKNIDYPPLELTPAYVNDTNKRPIRFRVVDNDNNNNNKLDKYIEVDEYGYVVLKDLLRGHTYTLTEENTVNDHYQKITESYTIKVDNQGNAKMVSISGSELNEETKPISFDRGSDIYTVYNGSKSNIKIQKIKANGQKIDDKSAKFKLYKADEVEIKGNELVLLKGAKPFTLETKIVNSDGSEIFGETELKDVDPIEEWVLVETESPTGYNKVPKPIKLRLDIENKTYRWTVDKDSEKYAQVDTDGKTIKVINTQSQIAIEKVDADSGQPIKGNNSLAKFKLWKESEINIAENGNISRKNNKVKFIEITTDTSTGKSAEKEIEEAKEVNWVLEEIQSPNTYRKLTKPIKLLLEKSGEKFVWKVREDNPDAEVASDGITIKVKNRQPKIIIHNIDEQGRPIKSQAQFNIWRKRDVNVSANGQLTKKFNTAAPYKEVSINQNGQSDLIAIEEAIIVNLVIEEFQAPDGYHKLPQPIKLKLKDGSNYKWELEEANPYAEIGDDGRTIKVKNRQTKLVIQKIDPWGNPISNNAATFEVWNRDDRNQSDISKPIEGREKIAEIKTIGSKAESASQVIPPNASKLVLIESQAPTGYRKLTKPIELTLNKETLKWEVDNNAHPEVSVDENGIVKIQNKKQIVIEKLDEEGNLIPNSTATFEIWRLRDVKLQNEKLVLDENGNITPKYHHSTPMRTVTVTNGKSDPIDIAKADVNILIFEKKAPEGYNKMTNPIKLAVGNTKNQWTLVNPNEVTGVEVADDMTIKVRNRKKTVVKFGKINLKGNALYNMKLKIKPVEGNENKPIFKNTKGDYEGQELENEKALTWSSRIIKNKWPEIELGDGKYTLEELETTDGYSKFAPFNIEVKEGVVSIKAPDSVNANDIAIVESGTMPLVKIKNYKGEMKINVIDNSTPENKHKDVKFKLVKDGKLVGSASTGTNGSLTFTNIEPGTYKLTQETGPNWFHLNEKTYTIEVLPDYNVSIKNKDNKLSVKDGSPTVKTDGITKLIELDFTIDKNLPLGVLDGGNTSYLILIFVGISALVSIVIYSINKRRKAL